MNKKNTLLFALSATLFGGNVLATDKRNGENNSKKDAIESVKGGSNWASVGSDNDCDYRLGTTKIQDAIDAGHDEVRIVEGTYAENVLIDDISVKLFGGYPNCTDANNNDFDNASTDSKIRPATGSGLPAVRVEGDSQNNKVTFRNLSVERGEGSNSHFGGGISIKDADVDVTMSVVAISQNEGWFGGGLSVTGGTADVKMEGVQISSNDASLFGGGIFCQGLGNKVEFNIGTDFYGSTIFSNSAAGGGGVAVQAQCHFVSYVGGTAFSGILVNTALGDGGGIRATNGAFVELIGNKRCYDAIGPIPAFCEGNDTGPVDVSINRADSDNNNTGNGGAIYASGSDTVVRATNVRVNSNRADDGGAVFVSDGASFETKIANVGNVSFKCWDNGRCNQYKGNKTSESNGGGGAFYADTGGKIVVIGTHIEENRADSGTAFYLRDAGTDLKLEGSYITGNGSATADGYNDSNAFNVFSDASARIDYSTIADNEVSTSSGTIRNNSASVRIYSSIVHDLSGAPALVTGSPVLNSADCVIANDLGVISGISNVVADPEFVDRANNDYHLNASLSPAVDFCDEAVAEHTAQDTDQENRGWDDYTTSNNLGPFDIGADESYGNDIIFENGLE